MTVRSPLRRLAALAALLALLGGCGVLPGGARYRAESRVAALRRAMPRMRAVPLVRRASGDSTLAITAYLEGDELRIHESRSEVRGRQWDEGVMYFDAGRPLAQRELMRFAPGVDRRGRQRIEIEWLFDPDGTVLWRRMTIDGRERPLPIAAGATLQRMMAGLPGSVRSGVARHDSILGAGGDPLAP